MRSEILGLRLNPRQRRNLMHKPSEVYATDEGESRIHFTRSGDGRLRWIGMQENPDGRWVFDPSKAGFAIGPKGHTSIQHIAESAGYKKRLVAASS